MVDHSASKDVKAFTSTAKKFNVDLSIVNAVHQSNKKRIENIANKIIRNIKKAKVLTILGLSFKPNTDDIRESTSIKLAVLLKSKGYQINVFDPASMENTKKEIDDFNYFDSALKACNGSDAVIICTEWNEFRALNFKEIAKIINSKKIFDLRNIYNRDELEKLALSIMELEDNLRIVNFDPEILREYDIRGIVDRNITENIAYTIGRVFGYIVSSKLNSNEIVVGYDGRLTSPKLFKALSIGLKHAGSNVANIGMCPTPMVYFGDYFLKSDAAIMITGSHNPSEYNGFKMVLNKHSFFSKDIQNFNKIVSEIKLDKKNGNIKNFEISDSYVKRILKNITIDRKLKIAWDIGNGAMGTIIDKLVTKLKNTENILLNKEVDGNFPNHHLIQLFQKICNS